MCPKRLNQLITRCYNKAYSELNKEKFREYHKQKYLANKAQLLREAQEVRNITKVTKEKETNGACNGKCLECGVAGKTILKTKCM